MDWVQIFDFMIVLVQLTPYLGTTLQGVVYATILRGQLVYREGSFCPEPLGKHLFIAQRKTQGQLWSIITSCINKAQNIRIFVLADSTYSAPCFPNLSHTL